MNSLEQTGEKFSLQTYFEARRQCQSVVDKIVLAVSEGMSEADGQDLVKEEFKKIGVSKFWHPSKFRIGTDTLKTFRDLPDKEICLTSGEMFFLDVGPIIDGHEADYGDTFVFGGADKGSEDFSQLAQASKEIWHRVADVWRNEHISGLELYQAAEKFALNRGYQLNPLMAGHRLGDFPHALFSKEALFSINFSPMKNLWVLEIHIRSEKLQRGAFFEDILSDELTQRKNT
jgi:Xaa-Pro aminopeptidase